MPHDLDWQRDGPGWPHADRSRFVQAGGLRWHVQRFAPAQTGAPRSMVVVPSNSVAPFKATNVA